MLKRTFVLAAFSATMCLTPPLNAKPRSSGSHSTKARMISGVESTSTERVTGYFKKDGTYVAPHDKTKADKTKLNNWSTKGNINPETGKPGTKDPYAEGPHHSAFYRLFHHTHAN